MTTLLIIADDLTGAADTAARCRHAGLPAAIGVTATPFPLTDGALALQTDSRHLSAAEAAERVRGLCATYATAADVHWYKKIDSTLRGNISAELDALLTLLEENGSAPVCAVVSPAFPAQARGTENGYLVHADTPAGSVFLPDILQAQSTRTVALIPLTVVRRGVSELIQPMQAAIDAGATILAVDSMGESDLDTLILAGEQLTARVLFCGSAGLAGAYVRKRLAKTDVHMAAEPVDLVAHSILCVAGSGSPMAQRQRHQLLKSTIRVEVLVVGVDGATEIEDWEIGGWETGRFDAEESDTVVTLAHLPAPKAGAQLDGPQARQLAARLAATALQVFRRKQPDVIVLVGGDTAIQTLTLLGIAQLTVQRELLPGMPLTVGTAVIDGRQRPVPVVLKSGNHGDPNALVTLIDLLTEDAGGAD